MNKEPGNEDCNHMQRSVPWFWYVALTAVSNAHIGKSVEEVL
jgi:hypothetical protein